MKKINQNLRVRLFSGPSIHVPFKSIQAEFSNPFEGKIKFFVIQKQWRLISDRNLWPSPKFDSILSFHEMVVLLAINLQHPFDGEHALFAIKNDVVNDKKSIFFQYIDPSATALALRAAVLFSYEIFKSIFESKNLPVDLAIRLKKVRFNLESLLPQRPIIRALVHEAQRRTIPVLPVAENSQIFLFGQGCKGAHFFEASTDKNSSTGMNLQRNKIFSNLLVKRLGFPGVKHAVAHKIEQALEIAHQMIYPLVVKPIASSKGNGVSALVTNDANLETAYKAALAFSNQGVIIEKHVKGHDHRLAVFGGKVAWVAARYPASVTGDGNKTIEELIQAENLWREKSELAADGGLLQLVADADMLEHLNKSGHSLKTRLADGESVSLRSVSNISKGGSIADVTERVHPDNIAMAEAIARGFRMDALGIDFMTPDISQSWRDVDCAVIEVNGMPGIFFDERVKKIIEASFPDHSEGRIPSVLLVDPPEGMAAEIARLICANGFMVGKTSNTSTYLGDYARCPKNENLFNRVTSLISDPSCEALVIETDANSLTVNGLPLDKLTLVLSFGTVPSEVDTLLVCNSNKVLHHCRAEEDYKNLIEKILK